MEPERTLRCGYVTVGPGRMHYREAGSRHHPCLLLLHQSPSSSAMYETLMLQLADDFHLLAPDTPGFGNSEALAGAPGDADIAQYAAAIRGFLDAMGIAQCQLFGHHTGAGIAVQLAHDFPEAVTAMVLSGPPLLSEELKTALPGLASPIPLAADGSHLLAMWQRIAAKDPEAPLAIIQREVQLAFGCGDHYQASYIAVTEQPFAQQLPSIDCPVLVFAGDADPLYGAVEPTVALLPNARRVELPGGERTYVCERQAPWVADQLRAFLTSPELNKKSE
ncbi:MAG: alpha/beta hydrolase [Halioglobus sp.]